MSCIGVFDSGVGGLCALQVIRQALPQADIVYLADTANAPYGTKSRGAVAKLVQQDIACLRAAGAEAILVACMTASGACSLLPRRLLHGVWDVLIPTARDAAAASTHGRIGILATQGTVRAGILERQVRRLRPAAHLTVCAAQQLVSLVEEGHTRVSDPLARAAVKEALVPMRDAGVDTLILGCTHFPHLRACFEAAAEQLTLICSGEAGAQNFLQQIPPSLKKGNGTTRYIRTKRAQ